jgi:hypothetical protein
MLNQPGDKIVMTEELVYDTQKIRVKRCPEEDLVPDPVALCN